ncbi:MAG TPA: PRC-barrel domain-containing protein [Acetobacteraceae bacterium]|nr:PRC-barrel domain-containing protein [Acetobacteraceae bacterium]
MARLDDTSNTSGRLIAASKVSGTNVYNLNGEKLGSVYDVMLDKITGRAEYAIMSFGGFLGIGERYHPLPWHVLNYRPSEGGYVVDIDRSRLEGAPSYEGNELWSNDTWGTRVDDYYGVSMREDMATRPTSGAGLGSKPPHM